MSAFRLVLDQDDFRTLIRGGIVVKEESRYLPSGDTITHRFEVALADIGFDVMDIELGRAIAQRGRRR